MIEETLPDLPGSELMKQWGLPKFLRRILLFSEISFSAWLIDMGGLTLLLYLGVPVFVAAFISPLPALLWAFTWTTYKLYFRRKGFSRTRFLYYVLFNLGIMLGVASTLSFAAKHGYHPVAVKVLVSPVTFLLNFFFTKKLLKDKKSNVEKAKV